MNPPALCVGGCREGCSSKGFYKGSRYKTCIHCLLTSSANPVGDAARKELRGRCLQLVLCVLIPQSSYSKPSLPSLILNPKPAFMFHCSLLWDHGICLECGVGSQHVSCLCNLKVSHISTLKIFPEASIQVHTLKI